MFKRVLSIVYVAAILMAACFVVSGVAAASPGENGEYASTSLTAAELFDRARLAGGTIASGQYHKVSRTQSTRGDVWTTETFFGGDDYRTTVTQGSFVSAFGSYEGREWRQDANGTVVAATGYSQEADPFESALRKPESPDSNVRILGVTTGSKPCYVVEVTPRQGLVERRYYDAGTYLLAQVEEVDYDGHHRLWEYSDYRSESGRVVAHSIAYSSDGTPSLQTKVLTYERVTVEPSRFVVPASKLLFAPHDADAVSIPAQFTEEGIIVRVTIGGRGLDFLLDSGASDILIDSGIARELGMPSSGSQNFSFAGDFTMSDTRAPDFAVGDLRANDVAMSTASFHEQLVGRRIVGLLGADFIAGGALEVNFEKKTVTMHASVPADLAARGWSVIPLRLDENVPLLKAQFSGKDGWFIADLGAFYSTLYPHYFSQFPIKVPKGEPDRDSLVTIGNRPFGVKHFTMNSMVLGDWVFGGVQVVVPSASFAQERDYDGLIGRETLSNFNLIFDYKNRQLWFKQIGPS